MKVSVLMYLIHNRLVATDMGNAGSKSLADKGIDIGVKALSVEASVQGMKGVVRVKWKGKECVRFMA